MPNHPLAVYIHWPFCKSKCPYCDFNSHVRERVEQERWRAALLRELEYMAAHMRGRTVTSIFFGGGTPSLMPPETAAALIDRVRMLFPGTIPSPVGGGLGWGHNLAPTALNYAPLPASPLRGEEQIEITLEANPTSVEASTFPDFKKAGINRVSLGVQSLRDEELRFLGRGHSAHEALHAIALARDAFERYSFDLIYARPNQTPAAWEAELTEALRYAGDHVSLYQLTIEENTAFHHAYAKGGFILPDENEAEVLYRLTEEMTAAHGLHAYEVSNYAAAGQESRHNLAYWRGDDYIGIGPGAHGRLTLNPPPLEGGARGGVLPAHSSRCVTPHPTLPLKGGGFSRVATQTIKSPERWLEQVERQGHGIELWEAIDRRREAEERVMMGLRLRGGIAYEDFARRAGFDLAPYIDAGKRDFYIAQGLLENDPARLRATLKGRLVLTALTAELLG